MRSRFVRSTLVLSMLFGAAACGGGSSRPAGDCAAGLLSGDVVITEIMANPAGTDSGKEWFELYNATTDPLDLAGLRLVSSKEDESSEKEHLMEALEIDGEGYVVVGGVLNDEGIRPDYVDYGYEGDLGDLRNTAGRLAVACGETIIDEVTYAEVGDGVSRGYDGARTPDASGNDDITAWCDATSVFEADQRGTPGGRNDACLGGTPTTCVEDGETRDVIAPMPGDLVITEFHANPMATGDDDGEWFEVQANARVDLNGLEFGREPGEPDGGVAALDCVTVEAGQYLVFARGEDPGVNGGLPDVTGVFDFSLANSAGRLFIGRGGEELDAVSWVSTSDGAASNLDPDYADPTANDDPGVFCPSTTAYGAGDLGTPGAANEQCAITPPTGQCLDGDTLIDIDAPAAGEIVITEFLANPEASEETDGEWIELAALGDFHLNGLELGRTPGEIDTTVEVEPCIVVSAGDFVVLARSDDMAINGGLPVVHATFDFSLVNSDGSLFVGWGGEVLDEVTWTSTTAAAASSLDPDSTDASANDDEASFCPAVDAYGDGDLGTPGAANPACGGTGTGLCTDGGNERRIVPPTIGDLVITEVMPDPSAVADAEGEWFELLVTADVDLNGLELGAPAGDADETLPVGGDCLVVTAGTRIVFAQNSDAGMNGGLPDPFATFAFGLTNAAGSVSVGRGGVTLDAVSWTDSDPGTALNLDPAAEDSVANDDTGNFCAATMPYGDGDLGTPGAANTDCGVTADGMCDDGGRLRPIVEPLLGEVVITEVMPNPNAVADASGEWFELLVTADVDLNGLELGAPAGEVDVTLPPGGECLAVAAGTRVVFARNADGESNGGLPPALATFSFGLVNADGSVSVGLAGSVLDAVTWTSSDVGASLNLDSGAEDAVANDDEMNFCAATMPYGAGDLGTPAATNEACL